jgi:enoyl-CoA hydratase
MAPAALVTYSLDHRVATLTLNREERRNALNPELIEALREALTRAENDPDVGAIILTGAGDRSFCSGADLGAAAATSALGMHAQRRAFADLLVHLSRLGRPVVGAANGHALAGGFGLLQACDFVVARRDARYGTPEIKRGLFPMMILAVLLETLGRRHTLELALTGRELDGDTLFAWGGANHVVEAVSVMDTAIALARDLATLPAGVMALGRRALYAAESMPLEAQLDFLCSQLTLNTFAEDAVEGLAAFFEKREANWTHR